MSNWFGYIFHLLTGRVWLTVLLSVLFLASCGGGAGSVLGNIYSETQESTAHSTVSGEPVVIDVDKVSRILCRPGLSFALTIFLSKELQIYERRLCGSSDLRGELAVERMLFNFDDIVGSQRWRCLLDTPQILELVNREIATDLTNYCVEVDFAADVYQAFEYIQLESFTGAGGFVDQLSLEQSIAEVGDDRLPVVTAGSGSFYFERIWNVKRDINILGAGKELTFFHFLDPESDSLVISALEYPPYELGSRHERGDMQLLLNSPLDFSAGLASCSLLGGVIEDLEQPWPFDSRDGLNSGELISIKKKDGRLIEISEPLRSSYGVGTKVSIFCPLRVTLAGFAISAEQDLNEKKVVNIKGVAGGSVEKISISGGTKAAIWIGSSKNFLIQGNDIQTSANLGCRTCYGVQTYGAQDLVIRKNAISGARRGIDISGTFPSRRILVSHNVIFAPSENYKVLRSSGVGTHGTAVSSLFYRNEVYGGAVSALVRGDDIDLVENRLLGAEISGIYIQDGKSHAILGNIIGGKRLSGEKISRGVEYAASGGPDASFEVRSNKIEAKTCIFFKSLPENLMESGNSFECTTVFDRDG